MERTKLSFEKAGSQADAEGNVTLTLTFRANTPPAGNSLWGISKIKDNDNTSLLGMAKELVGSGNTKDRKM